MLHSSASGIGQSPAKDVTTPNGRSTREHRAGAGESFHFHRTDGEGEWVIRFVGEDVIVTREHATADVAVRGTVSNLFLFLWGRVPASALDVVGDASLLKTYRELVPNPT